MAEAQGLWEEKLEEEEGGAGEGEGGRGRLNNAPRNIQVLVL